MCDLILHGFNDADNKNNQVNLTGSFVISKDLDLGKLHLQYEIEEAVKPEVLDSPVCNINITCISKRLLLKRQISPYMRYVVIKSIIIMKMS